jgi:plasmid stability protein
MPALQIRNLPEDVHRKLKARAAERGQSLSEYAAQVLRHEVETLSVDELWQRIKSRDLDPGTATSDDIVAIIRQHRDGGA